MVRAMERSPYADALSAAMDAARAAGAMLRAEFHRPGGPRGGGSHADVDVEVEHFLREALLPRFPWAWRGEETPFSPAPAGSPRRCWVVDPNDGTSPFLEGHRGAAVSIGLLDAGVPVLGVVYAYAHPDDDGDLVAWAEGCGAPTRNGVELPTNLAEHVFEAGDVVLVSQHADGSPHANAACVAPGRYRPLPSIAYRLALVAAGEAVAAVSLAGPAGWDLCAGHALVRGAGGVLIGGDGAALTYDDVGTGGAQAVFGGAPTAVRTLPERPWASVYVRAPKAWRSPVRLRKGEHVDAAGLLARAQGCMLGQFAGDALGSLVEFQTAARIARAYPRGVRDLADGGSWNTLAGQCTDDSEMALMLARSLVAQRAFDEEDIAAAYAHWFASHPFDSGGTTRQAVVPGVHAAAGARAVAMRTAASTESQANGSLMRVSPLGIFGAASPARAAELARVDSGLTHPHPLCRDACASFVRAIAESVADGGGPEAAYAAAMIDARLPGRDPGVASLLLAARSGPPDDFMTHQGWVRVAFHNAFFQLLHARSLEEGLVDTVGRGGDTDTNGAIAGALLGAVHGRGALPMRWTRVLLGCRPVVEAGARRPRPMEFWPSDGLVLAERLVLAGRSFFDG